MQWQADLIREVKPNRKDWSQAHLLEDNERPKSISVLEVCVRRSFSPAIWFGCILLCWLASSDAVAQANAPNVQGIPEAQTIPGYMRQAQEALRANQPNVAAQAYENVLKLDPNNLAARANLGVVAMSTGNWSKAAENLEAALKLQPSQDKVRALLGLCLVHLGRSVEARDLLTEAVPGLENTRLKHEAGLALVSVLSDNGEWDKASSLLTTLRDLYPDDPAISYAAFRIHSELEFQGIESLAVNAPDSLQFHRALAEHLVNDGRTEAAITEYRKALAISPDSPELHFELGQALFFESHVPARLEEAQKEFEYSLRFNPGDARSECELAEIEVLRSNPAGASSHFSRALTLNPGASCAKAGMAKQLMDKGQDQQALEYLQAAIHDDPYNELLHYRLWSLYRRTGDKEKAESEMETFKQLRAMKDELQQTLHPTPPPE
jgi:tetratricopeptide (TPR) repeat protein